MRNLFLYHSRLLVVCEITSEKVPYDFGNHGAVDGVVELAFKKQNVLLTQN